MISREILELLLTSLMINIQRNFVRDFTDNDECSDGTHTCSANATCDNTDGGYNCSCDSGYEGNGFNCTSKCEVILV